jgi:hypothetical protein
MIDAPPNKAMVLRLPDSSPGLRDAAPPHPGRLFSGRRAAHLQPLEGAGNVQLACVRLVKGDMT